MESPSSVLIYKVSDEEFKTLCQESNTIIELLTTLNLQNKYFSAIKFVRKRCAELGIAYPRNTLRVKRGSSLPLEEILVNPSPVSPTTQRTRILKAMAIPYVCAECGITHNYNDKPIVLQMDHINGNNKDARIENLRFLCPNCHSQTPTYNGRNRRQKGLIPRTSRLLSVEELTCSYCKKTFIRLFPNVKSCSNECDAKGRIEKRKQKRRATIEA